MTDFSTKKQANGGPSPAQGSATASVQGGVFSPAQGKTVLPKRPCTPSPAPAAATASAQTAAPFAAPFSPQAAVPSAPQAAGLSPARREQYAALLQALRGSGRVAVAYSGGVDSTFLLAAALAACGKENVLALTACTAALPPRELAEAQEYAAACGVQHTVLYIDAFAVPQFAANAPDRCYHCKKALFTQMLAAAHDAGFPVLCEGSNADDVRDYRPGLAAIAELGVESPLRAAALTKADIRAISQALGLPTWHKPSYACLATRVPYDTPLTPALLEKVDRAEQALHAAGFAAGRVRVHGDAARIEVPAGQLDAVWEPRTRALLTAGVKAAGFLFVAVDTEGYRTGSMNDMLPR